MQQKLTVVRLVSVMPLNSKATPTDNTNYHKIIAGKFGTFGKLSMIRQNKTIQISTYN